MTKKDYELVAHAIRIEYESTDDTYNAPDTARAAIVETAARLARAFKRENDSFNLKRFLSACGIEA